MRTIELLVLFLLCPHAETQIGTLSDSLQQRTTAQPATITTTSAVPSISGLPTGLSSCSTPEFNGGCYLGTLTAFYGILTFHGCRTTSDDRVVTLPPVTSTIPIQQSLQPDISVITSFTTVHNVGRSNFEVLVSQEVNTTAMDAINLAYSSYLAQPGTCTIGTTTGLDYRSTCVTVQQNIAGSTTTVPLTASVPYNTAQNVLCGVLNPCCAYCWFEFDVCQNAKGCSNQKNYFKCIDGMRYNVPMYVGDGNSNPYTMTGVPFNASSAGQSTASFSLGILWFLQMFLTLS
jgi:hypothetical protein